MKRLILTGLFAAAVLSLNGCQGPTAPAPSAAPATGAAPAVGHPDAAAGGTFFAATCSACHGPQGAGIKGLGKDLQHSTFVKGLSDAKLQDFIKKGRDASDPQNTTKIAMPPKGGNPALTDAQLGDIIAFLRSIGK